jgi:uncharacterized membrane protein (DUF2068 family)
MQEVVPRKRPLGVTIIALIEIIGAIALLLLSFAAISTSFGISLVIAAIIRLIVVWGLWMLKRWAFWVAVVFEALHFCYNLSHLLTNQSTAIETATGMSVTKGSVLFSLILSLVILVYLFADRHVRAAFRT